MTFSLTASVTTVKFHRPPPCRRPHTPSQCWPHTADYCRNTNSLVYYQKPPSVSSSKWRNILHRFLGEGLARLRQNGQGTRGAQVPRHKRKSAARLRVLPQGQHGLPFSTMALITSDCGATRYLGSEWP